MPANKTSGTSGINNTHCTNNTNDINNTDDINNTHCTTNTTNTTNTNTTNTTNTTNDISGGNAAGSAFALLVEEVGKRSALLTSGEHGAFVGSELLAVDRALSRILAEGLARGPVFCEWGSGLGGACGVAALQGFRALGIEIQRELVDSARVLAENLSLPMVFAEGSFLLPGDEDLVSTATDHTELTFDSQAWDEMNLAPADCDVVFAYPWPGEEEMVDRTFARHASAEAILMTFHDFDRVLVQRKPHHQEALRTLGWM